MSPNCCTRCILDTSASPISFDEEGVCNYCRDYEEKAQRIENTKKHIQGAASLIRKIKAKRKGTYDCIIGISGGLDSSYLLYYIKKAGLRPLAVHFDCGWNTEKAVKNIELLTTRLAVDLDTYVVDWEEFRDVQLAYLKAGVVDLEIPTDHAFHAALYKTALKYSTKYILTGHNLVTEAIMPGNWVYNKGDARNLIDIHKKFGVLKQLKSFPILTLWRKFYCYNIKRIEQLHLLNYLSYEKELAGQVLQKEIGWQVHPVKHGESIWTRFYQCYILPGRFGIDKRKAHLSNLICSKQIKRERAEEEMKHAIYDENMLASDKDFIQKKFDISNEQLNDFMKMPIRKHTDFKSDRRIKELYEQLRNNAILSKLLNASNRW